MAGESGKVHLPQLLGSVVSDLIRYTSGQRMIRNIPILLHNLITMKVMPSVVDSFIAVLLFLNCRKNLFLPTWLQEECSISTQTI